ncbi:SRPBCC family protein, partial [Rhodococcus opacus]
IFLSHRTWEATILEQVPDERIVWRSKGAKGFIDGAVTFHEVTPDLTRIVLILEYHPKGLFEKTGNLWRAQGRRARLELKHFARHVMTQAVLHPDEVEGWRGEIRDGQVVEQEEDEAQPEESEDLEEEETDESEGEEPEGEEPEGDEAEETNEDDTEETDEDAGEQTDEDEEAPPPRRRGRPRKTAAAAEDQAPKRRGRPRKTAAKTAGSRQGARR